MTNKKTNKSSAKRKLVPAIGMLTVSAMMLSSATYAWFTMSREVEVNNIQMTATTPEDIQISLGKLSTTAGSEKGLATNNGVLVGSGSNADNGSVAEPGDVMEYWSNTADISNYYQLGRIIPASSTTGLNIYYTPDADGVGKTLKAGAKYYQAATGGTPAYDADSGTSHNTNMRTTLHAYTTEHGTGDTWYTATEGSNHYVTASEYNQTNDDGYYVDIPVWLRTSSTAGANLSVDAYVTSNSSKDDDDLYMAARAVILNAGRTAVATTDGETEPAAGLIEIRQDGWDGASIVNYMYSTNSSGEAVQSVNDSNEATYHDAARYNGNANVVKLTGPTGNGQGYGTATQVWIRVWLEGEDPNCWNNNAGQDFNICLKFVKGATTPAASNPYTDDTTTIRSGDTVAVNFKGASTAAFNTMTFAYSGEYGKGGTWTYKSGTFRIPTDVTFAIGGNDIESIGDIIDYLNTDGVCDTKAKAEAGVNIIATGATVTFTGTPAQASVFAAAIPTNATSIMVAGTPAATPEAAATAAAAATTDTVTVTYVAPVPVPAPASP
jgi:hypothetical protein